MGESDAHCYKESWSNGHDEQEKQGDQDTPFDKMESLHQLSEAELHNKEGPLPSTIHRQSLGLTSRIELLLLPERIFGLQLDCDSS